jgi:hypothetical protein
MQGCRAGEAVSKQRVSIYKKTRPIIGSLLTLPVAEGSIGGGWVRLPSANTEPSYVSVISRSSLVASTRTGSRFIRIL